ncbi:MAG: divalent-cation tolerance protein CutA [Planctomycetota bacterium]|jgi:periplasmic divalent cation tolerance protein
MSEAIVVMVTCGNSAEAETIAGKLLQERLVACVNIAGRIRSLFHWEGAVARESESLLLMKTRSDCFDALSSRIKELHSYEVPEIIGMPIMVGNPDYLDWIRESTTPAE